MLDLWDSLAQASQKDKITIFGLRQQLNLLVGQIQHNLAQNLKLRQFDVFSVTEGNELKCT